MSGSILIEAAERPEKPLDPPVIIGPAILHRGDVLAVLRTMPDNSVDSIVTDPPYELGFMGKAWDASGIAYNVDMWREALRVLKPGGHGPSR
jgi:site-specific DNA-methyltransferase (adenine-specific)